VRGRTLQGGWCDAGESNPKSTQPGFDPPVNKKLSCGNLALQGWALATVVCKGAADVR